MAKTYCKQAKVDIFIDNIGENMKTVIRTILIAEEGMVLTDGKNYGQRIYLADDADASVWREVSEEEAMSPEGDIAT